MSELSHAAGYAWRALGWLAMVHALFGCSQDASPTGAGVAGNAGSSGSGAAGSSGSGGDSAGSGSGGSAGSAGAGMSLTECAISAPTTWTAGVHVANCKVEVTSTLSIEPGAVIKFGPGFHLDVHPLGKLLAIGTESLPIVFTSLRDDAHGGDTGGDGPTTAARNDWGCQGACGDLNLEGSGSVLEHVHDLYGSNGVYVRADSVEITNSTFAHHEAYGLVLDGSFPVETTQLSGNAFYDNGGHPLHLGKPVFLNATNIFHDPHDPESKNGKQCIELVADIDRLTVLGVVELGFLFSGRRISSELLAIEGGVTFKAQGGAIYLDAGGSFVNGPNALFTSYADDSLGGDCTGDGAAAPAEGDWEGLWIDDGTTADYAAPADYIRYAANSGTMPLH